MKKFPDGLLYLIIVMVLFGHAKYKAYRIDAPLPPPKLGPMLPEESPRDGLVRVNVNQAVSSLGTAFSVDTNGNWLTARHVVDGCTDVGLNLGGSQIIHVESKTSPVADIALLSANWKRKPLVADLFTNRQIGEYGYFFGFPQGQPGEVVGALLGRNRLMVRGRYSSNESILAWTEIGRTRGLKGSLGGLSGGPGFDKDGEVIGIVTAESPRRGRVYTVAPRNLQGLIDENPGNMAKPISLNTYGMQADTFRRDRRIAQVVCVVN